MGSALLLGVVEGVTEFLPVSSTAHLVVAAQLLGVTASSYRTSFTIAIQCGAVAAVIATEWERLWHIRGMAAKVIVAFLPTGLLGALFYPIIRDTLNDVRVMLWALFLGGVVMVLFERFHGERANALRDLREISYRQAAAVGAWQALAFIPGVSRAAATVVGGMLTGLSRHAVVEFSFLLAIPTLTLATGYDLLQNAGGFSAVQVEQLIAGSAAAFAVAWITVRFFLQFITRHTFMPFAVYRIVLAAALWFILRV